jgi:hypothetical protein
VVGAGRSCRRPAREGRGGGPRPRRRRRGGRRTPRRGPAGMERDRRGAVRGRRMSTGVRLLRRVCHRSKRRGRRRRRASPREVAARGCVWLRRSFVFFEREPRRARSSRAVSNGWRDLPNAAPHLAETEDDFRGSVSSDGKRGISRRIGAGSARSGEDRRVASSRRSGVGLRPSGLRRAPVPKSPPSC